MLTIYDYSFDEKQNFTRAFVPHRLSKFFFGTLLISLLILNNSLSARDSTGSTKIPPPQYSIQISNPMDNQTFENAREELPVTVTTTPALENGDMIQIYLDGQPVGDPRSSTTITIPRLERGTHTLQAVVIQSRGMGATSNLITIHQKRNSL
jgi:hypothetical protein